MNRSLVYVLLLFLLLPGCKGPGKDKDVVASSISIDKVKLTDLENKSISLSQYHGKTIFLSFWASWCKPCLAEMPSIQKAQEILLDKEVVFLLASSESTEEINSFQNSQPFKFNYARVENSEELSIQGLPTTFIFSPGGQLVFSEMGTRKWNEKDNIDLILKMGNNNE